MIERTASGSRRTRIGCQVNHESGWVDVKWLDRTTSIGCVRASSQRCRVTHSPAWYSRSFQTSSPFSWSGAIS